MKLIDLRRKLSPLNDCSTWNIKQKLEGFKIMEKKTYNSPQEMPTEHLEKMLTMEKYSKYHDMVRSELEFRKDDTPLENLFTNPKLINTKVIDNLSSEKLEQVAKILGVA